MTSVQKTAKPAGARGDAAPQDKRKMRTPLDKQVRKTERDKAPSFVFTDWASI